MNMKPIELTVDLSEKKKEEPKTLADVEPYVACVASHGYVMWRDESGKIIATEIGSDGKTFVAASRPVDIKISRILGPIRIKFIL